MWYNIDIMEEKKEKINNIYSKFNKEMSELLTQKKALINDFKRHLENRKINQLKDEIIKK